MLKMPSERRMNLFLIYEWPQRWMLWNLGTVIFFLLFQEIDSVIS